MRHILIILSLFLFSFTVISCKSNKSSTTSDNGTTIVSDNETTLDTLDNITISSGIFVAVGHQEYSCRDRISGGCKYISKLLTSTDNGTTWSSFSFNEGYLLGISYVNETFLVGLRSAILTSSDGISWSIISLPNSYFSKIFYGNGTYLAPYCAGYTLRMSYDLRTWELSLGGSCIFGGAYGNNTFVVGGQYPRVYTSTDYGTNWNLNEAGSGHNITDIIFANNIFVATSSGGTILYSSDNGVTWTENSSGISNGLNSIFYANSTFVAVGDGGKIITSSNAGISWNERTSGTTNNLTQITYGNGTFVVVGSNESVRGTGSSIIITSTDNGSTWESMFTSKITNRLSGVTFKQ